MKDKHFCHVDTTVAQHHICCTFDYTGCIKKMVIELWSAVARSLYNVQKSFFHSRKDQAF